MPCLVVVIALLFPRVAILLLFFFSTYLDAAYETVLWPLLGFLFLPFATLAYAFAMNAGGGLVGLYLVVFIIAVLADVGAFSGASWRRG